MTKDWIDHLTQDLRAKNREAAENFGREQHKAAIIAAQGQPFFTAVTISLEENISEIKRQLQGDATASETTFQTINPGQLELTRSRFPWFDARITHHDGTIALDYARGLGVMGDPKLDRKTRHFAFQVADDDSFSIHDSFSDTSVQFQQPEQLARYITELLFSA